MRRYLLIILVLSFTLFIAFDAHAISKRGEMAEKLYLQENYSSAAYECERLFRENDVVEFKSEIAYLGGLCYLKLKKFSNAKKFFEYVLNNSGDSLLLSEAQIGIKAVAKGSPSITTPSYFSVQVGSFKAKKNALRLFKRFKRRKYTVRVTDEKDGSVTVYKVKIGRFKTRDAAVKFAKKLRKQGHQTIIVSY
ncbi:MAG: SPOR domain-containing protein [Candidatus Omnitrophota bacterium]